METYAEKFLLQIAKEKGVSAQRAAELTDICLKLTSAQLGVDFSDVYSSIYSKEFMQSCLKVKCSELELDQCEKECSCVIFEGKCYPRYFPNAKEINENPDDHIQKLNTEELSKLVKLASYLYYNYDGGGLTDNTFDALEYHLQKRLKARGRLYEKIGAAPVEKLRAVLPYPMASLNKVKPGSRELFDFISKSLSSATPTPPGLVWSLKLDGTSGLIVYKDSKPFKAYTRGDGAIGGDVSYILDFIKLPIIKKYPSIVIRGEFILSKENWNKYKGSYSNARSFVVSKINSGTVSQGINDLDFLAYEIVDMGNPKIPIPEPLTVFRLLDAFGLKVPEYGFLQTPTVFDLVELYKTKRTEAIYNIDGLVLSINASAPKVAGTANPKDSVAFKMRLEEQIRKTRILNLDWNISRYGRLVPVANYESVYIDGTRMHRASVHNAGHVRDWNLGKGSVIKVVRSGDVIPAIIDVEVDERIEPQFPPLDLRWHWKGNDIYLDDIENNRTVQLKRIEHFFVTIGVPRIREKTIEKLWLYGMRDIKSITNAKPADFIKIKGIGQKTAQSHYTNIHEVMKKTRLDRFIPAYSSIQLGIGRKLIKQLMRYHPTIMMDDKETIKRVLTKKNIPGFGPKRIENVAENIPLFRDFLFSLNREDVESAMKEEEKHRERLKTIGFNPKIRGRTFVISGFFGRMDLELEDYIYDNLGNFSDIVTSSTECVLVANVSEASKKVMSAQSLKIPILTIQEFTIKYDIPKFDVDGDEQSEDQSYPEPEDRND